MEEKIKNTPEEWSKGTWAVVVKDGYFGCDQSLTYIPKMPIGHYDEIYANYNNSTTATAFKGTRYGNYVFEKELVKWFATKQEAKNYSEWLLNKPTINDYQVGDIVELMDNSSKVADFGATAKITGVNADYIILEWLTNFNEQSNGLYYPGDFRLLKRKPKKPEFKIGDWVIIDSGYLSQLNKSSYIGRPVKVLYPTKNTPDYCINVDIPYNRDGGLNVRKEKARHAAQAEIDIVNPPAKYPGKAVHCTTQEEWDFVCKKTDNMKMHRWFKHTGSQGGNGKSYCASIEADGESAIGKNWSQTLDFYTEKKYKILSFQEWLNENGYVFGNELPLPKTNSDLEIGRFYDISGVKGVLVKITETRPIFEVVVNSSGISGIQDRVPDYILNFGGYYLGYSNTVEDITKVYPEKIDIHFRDTAWEENVCETCNGEGETMIAKLYPSGHTEVTDTCPDCDGGGYIEKVFNYIKTNPCAEICISGINPIETKPIKIQKDKKIDIFLFDVKKI
ncbi:hypothetical protein [Tenacibaculum sp.]|uniref:hypothetical protein n=1 Tax=Tenacibaculum sp. TaxID=1906242 RepID=UPI003D0B4A85